MATDMGKGQETKNIIWLTIEEDIRKESSKESMIDSCEIMFSVNE